MLNRFLNNMIRGINSTFHTPFSSSRVVPTLLSNQTHGMLTGTRLRILDPDNPSSQNCLSSVVYYDGKGRIIQSQAQNIQEGTDIVSNQYFFQGALYKSVTRHIRTPMQLVFRELATY